MKNSRNEIIMFNNQEIKLEVNMQDETVWLIVNKFHSYLIVILKQLVNILIML